MITLRKSVTLAALTVKTPALYTDVAGSILELAWTNNVKHFIILVRNIS